MTGAVEDFTDAIAAGAAGGFEAGLDELADGAVLDARVRELDGAAAALRGMLDAGEQLPGQLDRRLRDIGMFRWDEIPSTAPAHEPLPGRK